jgi:DNA-binding helix-hairpin-helix protein with protein kinase domain
LFRQFASARLHDRFATYPLAKDKVKIEERLQLLQREHAKTKLKMAALPQAVDDLRLNTYPEVQAADQAVQKVNQEFNDSFRLEREEIERLARYQAEYLLKHKITANSVAGIGKARIAALNSVGIVTAADIVTTNQTRALTILENIRGANPPAEWQKLEVWRDDLQVNMKPPPASVARSQSSTAISAAYATVRRTLQLKLDDLRREALRVRNMVLKNEQNRLRNLNSEVIVIERQIRETQKALQQYAKITPEILLDKIINSPVALP